MKSKDLLALSSVSLVGASAAFATSDYGPAVDHIITACAKYYTSGYGHQFCVVHDMEGYYQTGISYISRCDISVSCHYLANGLTDYAGDAPAGELSQLVSEDNYAWHAGCWNRHSLATEHEGFASNPAWFTEDMYQASAGLYRHWCDKFGIPKDRNHIVGHYQWQDSAWVTWVINNLGFDPRCNTHTDPGPYWDWSHYMDLIINGNYVNPPYWFSSGTDGWTVGNSLGALGYNNTDWPGIIYADQTGSDAFFYSPATSYTGGAEASVNVRVFPQGGTTANHDMQMFFISASDSTWSAAKSSPAVGYTAQNTWATINLDVNAASSSYYNQTIKQLRLDVDNNNSATRWIVDRVVPQSTPRWRFDADASGWTAINALTALAWTGTGWPGIVYTDQVGNDPQLVSPFMFYWGAMNDQVHVRVYPQNGTTANHNMQLFFSSASDGTFSEANSMTVYYTAKDVWADVYFSVGQRANWSADPILWLRIDPDQTNQGNRWIIDSVQIEHAAAAVGIAAPTIGQPPQALSVNQGSSATFSVFPNGTAPFTYQWRKNTANIGSATGSTYTVASAQPADAASYSVVVSNPGGSVTSSGAPLTVNATAPSITAQPANQTVTAGYPTTFSVTAAGTAPLSYQWRKNGSSLGGGTASVLTLNNVQTANQGSYSVVITNTSGTVTSSDATLTVLNTPPFITTQPQSQTVVAGASATFSAVAGGAIPLSYQWRLNGADISGATLSAYTRNNLQSGDAGTYGVVVTNSFGSAPSGAATLTVNVPPTITTQPQSQAVIQGSNVTFTASANGTAPLFFRWRKGGTAISGATGTSYSLSNVQAADAGTYAVVVTNATGSATSGDAVLTVFVPPSITTQPQSQSVVAGAGATFSVVASGTIPLSYQWRQDGTNIPGATASSYTRNNVQPADAGSYSVVVANQVGSLFSANAVLAVATVPQITAQPQGQTVSAGASAIFTVTATGGLPLAYQWRCNGVNLSGATGSSYTRSNIQSADVGLYSVVVSNAYGRVTSTEASLSLAAAIAFQDTFESGNLGQWTTVASPATDLAISTTQNHTSGGGYSAAQDSTGDDMYHNFGSYSGHTKLSCYCYDDGTSSKSFAEIRCYTGGSYPGSLSQVLAIGKYNGVTASGEIFDSHKYQLRVLYPSASMGWMNCATNSAGGMRAAGWHKFSIERLADGTTVNFTVDDVATRTVAGVAAQDWNTVLIGGGSGSTAITAYYDDVLVEYFDPPGVATQPADQTVTAGGSATFSVTATNNPQSYQWRLNGTNLPGATSTSLVIGNAQDTDAGDYAVLVANGAGVVLSASASLTVIGLPSITTPPQDQNVAAGATAIFTVTATGNGPLGYQWNFNAAAIAGATGTSYTCLNAQSANAGSYAVVVSNAGGAVTSAPAILTVNHPPVLGGFSNRTIHAGATLRFTALASDPDPGQGWSFSLEPGAPAGAAIDAVSGWLTWPTSAAHLNTTNAVTVRVTDTGTPALSDARSFTIVVVGLPVLAAGITSNHVVLSWRAIAGQTYRVQAKFELGDAEWTDVTDVQAAGETATLVDSLELGGLITPRKFYRIRVLE
jgi:N-acetyl-anhydromuramyl-L-alanine amidase AmpD